MISAPARDVLIEHIDGAAVPIILSVAKGDAVAARKASCRSCTVKALLVRGLLRKNRAATHTEMTEPGRAELAKLLAEYADALHRAGYAEPPGAGNGEKPVRARFPLPPANPAARIDSRG